jgi:hypothetical protein
MKQDPVPLKAVTLSLVGVLEHQPDRVAHLLFDRIHATDVGERGQLVGRLHLKVAAPATHPAAESAAEE